MTEKPSRPLGKGPFPLPAPRAEFLALLEAELGRCEREVAAMG
jgi:hypothetical protein